MKWTKPMPRHIRARQFIAEAHLIQTLIELSKQQRLRESNALMATCRPLQLSLQR